ncbi:MAG: hypothetical protein CYPHOPRED_004138 [Cyphobasidiales sp. Tagirdzhanova-0007]|nr:MAG: hypothetical protein CYPHOPRED_004138 [Cyphobasidiales sp. Tagirdzhanova-0007]
MGRIVVAALVGMGDLQLCILLLWEEATEQPQPELQPLPGQAGQIDSPSEPVEAAWRYYDIQQQPSQRDKKTWFNTAEEAIQSRDALVLARAKRCKDENEEGDGQEGEKDPDDYWGGVSDSQDGESGVGKPDMDDQPSRSKEDELYWTSLSSQEAAITETEPPIASSAQQAVHSALRGVWQLYLLAQPTPPIGDRQTLRRQFVRLAEGVTEEATEG